MPESNENNWGDPVLDSLGLPDESAAPPARSQAEILDEVSRLPEALAQLPTLESPEVATDYDFQGGLVGVQLRNGHVTSIQLSQYWLENSSVHEVQRVLAKAVDEALQQHNSDAMEALTRLDEAGGGFFRKIADLQGESYRAFRNDLNRISDDLQTKLEQNR